ncbi:MAG TPA: aldehyde ferredoxin oxidoreductase family protein [Thermoleophilia bacterium]|nr:aldehyde ferredoxin oxidoreductase family protein [Thermoleophilia bacterium]
MEATPRGSWWGRVLFVDVGTGETREEALDWEAARDFIGGRGLAAFYLFKHLVPGTDPLSPENPLIFAGGPLSGTSCPGSARGAVATKSPQSGIYTFGITGGELGPALKRSGYDVIIITGKAENPVYVEVGPGGAKLRSASHLWGLDTQLTQEMIKSERRGEDLAMTCIGQGGERLVPYACLINERRALGRGGAGAVMGSKNVKALVIKKDGPTAPLADPAAFREAARNAMAQCRTNPFTSGPLKAYGSVSTVAVAVNGAIMPADNWQRMTPVEEGKNLFGDVLREKFLVKDVVSGEPCNAKCSKLTLVREGPYAGAFTEGPEYETVYALGTACGIFDLAPIIQADMMCDLYGIDTMSVGVTIAFAMECYEKGLITKQDTGGIDLHFGNADAMVQLVHDAAFRRGFGEKIARGSREMAAEIGQGSEAFAMHTKGIEIGGYDPRGAKGMALVFGCGPRGGCHHAGGYTVTLEFTNPDIDRYADSGKVPIVLMTRNRRAAAADSGGTCAFLTVGMDNDTLAGMISAATGNSLTPADMMLAGERISMLERVLNVREGLRAADDVIPPRLLTESVPDGPTAGHLVDFDLMRREFYEASELDPETSLPSKEKLAKMNLTWVLDDPIVAALAR